MRQAVLFVGHGSPMIALEDSILTRNFKDVGDWIIKNHGKPEAILSISAHWFKKGNLIQNTVNPEQIYDMYGFPKELYQVKYPVKGCPKLSEKLMHVLGEENLTINNDWGIDHGTWTVLVHMFPLGDIPVVQLSVNYDLEENEVFSLGKKLTGLRDQGVLIMGSGNVVHNLRKVDWHLDKGVKEADEFDDIIRDSIISKDYDRVLKYREIENYKLSVPTRDHFLPLIYALGASEKDGVKVFNNVRLMGSISMTSYLWSESL